MMWDEKADRILIEGWNAGETLTSLADILTAAGYPITRNAVAGRKGRLPDEAFAGPRDKTVKTLKPPEKKRPVPIMKVPAPKPIPPTDDGFDLSTWEGINYLELTAAGCKAILDLRGSDGLPKVCGRPRGYDSRGARCVYCREHFRLYTQPGVKPQRRITSG